MISVFPPDAGLLPGGAPLSGGSHSGSGQRAAGQRERDPPGGAHLLQERDPASAVRSCQLDCYPIFSTFYSPIPGSVI